LLDADVVCVWKGTVPLKNSPSGSQLEKRESGVELSRSTGEITVYLKTWTYADAGGNGKPNGTSTLTQKGICRSIGRPVF